MSEQLFTVSQPHQVAFEIKKSRFVGLIFAAQSEQEALQQLRKIAAQHPTANHLAFAWRIRQPSGQISERLFDAGEPAGTAGRPILAPLQGENLINTAVAVVRYFGGVKLGTGGLTKAYGQAAKQVIAEAERQPWVEMQTLVLHIDYSQLQLLEYQLKQLQGQIVDQTFTENITVTVILPKAHGAALQAQFSTP